MEILRDQDPEYSNQENLNKFFKIVKKILKDIEVEEDPQFDLIGSLRKIESQLSYLAEARNHMVAMYHRKPAHLKDQSALRTDDIEAKEVKIKKQRQDEKREQDQKENNRK